MSQLMFPRVWVICSIILMPQFALAQVKLSKTQIFEMQDLDSDGKLTSEEYASGVVGKMLAERQEEFRRRDLDSDGEMTLEEFQGRIKWTEEELREREEKAFHRTDKNEDDAITLDEFVGEKEDVALKYATAVFKAVDADHDSRVTLEEYLQLRTVKNQPKLKYQGLDRDHDGKVTVEEFVGFNEGTPYGEKRRAAFPGLDKDGDGELSLAEFTPYETKNAFWKKISALPKEERPFAQLDKDFNGKLSITEFTAKYAEPVAKKRQEYIFRELDDNFDKFVDKQEFAMNKASGNDAGLAFAKRDMNADGVLSLEEQVASVKGKKWEKNRIAEFEKYDKNADDVLTRKEFMASDQDGIEKKRIAALPPLERNFLKVDTSKDNSVSLEEFIAAGKSSKERETGIFAVLDVNNDQALSLNEFLSKNDDKNVALKFAKRDRDGDGKLSDQEMAGWEVPEGINKDGGLNVNEFASVDRARTSKRRRNAVVGFVSSPMNWVTGLIVLFDIALVWFIGKKIVQSRRSPKSVGKA